MGRKECLPVLPTIAFRLFGFAAAIQGRRLQRQLLCTHHHRAARRLAHLQIQMGKERVLLLFLCRWGADTAVFGAAAGE